jgi:hypothetical protein
MKPTATLYGPNYKLVSNKAGGKLTNSYNSRGIINR